MAPRLDKEANTDGIDPNTFLRLYREIRAARTPMESAVGVYRNARKKAKAAGIDDFALGIMERLSKMEADAAGVALRNLFRYAGWTNTDLGVSQGDLFDAAPEQQPTTEAQAAYRERIVEEAGIAAGRNGEKIDSNPHPGGTPHHVAWVRGWHRGQEDAVHAAFGKPKATGPARRARNPAAETRDVLSATVEKLNEGPPVDNDEAVTNALGNPIAPLAVESADNAYPLVASPKKPKSKPTAPPANKASAKAAKAAEKLAGKPKVDAVKDATSGATAF